MSLFYGRQGGRLACIAGALASMSPPCRAQLACGSWSVIPGPETGGSGTTSTVFTLQQWDDGSGPALYARGRFVGATATIRNIARLSGSIWQPLGSGMDGDVAAMVPFDDGTGQALYVGGTFFSAGGTASTLSIARWNGQTWSSLGSGIGNFSVSVHALAVYDDGGGPGLYVGGQFPSVGTTISANLVCWRNGSWHFVQGTPSEIMVRALCVYDDGTGPALYVGGTFVTAGGQTVNNIARLRGASWSALGSGVTGVGTSIVSVLTVADEGSGPALYVGGELTRASGSVSVCLAAWRPGGWRTFPSPDGLVSIGVGGVEAIAALRYASTPTLFAGAQFWRFSPPGGPTIEGGMIAHTDGRRMQTVPPGNRGVRCAITLEDTPTSARVLFGGSLGSGPEPRPTLAIWTACQPCYANCDLSATSPVLNVQDFACFLNRFAAGDSAANCDNSTEPPVLNIADFSCFLNSFAAGCP